MATAGESRQARPGPIPAGTTTSPPAAAEGEPPVATDEPQPVASDGGPLPPVEVPTESLPPKVKAVVPGVAPLSPPPLLAPVGDVSVGLDVPEPLAPVTEKVPTKVVSEVVAEVPKVVSEVAPKVEVPAPQTLVPTLPAVPGSPVSVPPPPPVTLPLSLP